MIAAPALGWILELVAAIILLFWAFTSYRGESRFHWALPVGVWLIGHLIGGPGI